MTSNPQGLSLLRRALSLYTKAIMYDLIIIGGAAAGSSAAVYAARRMLNFSVIAHDLGGEVALSGEVQNWIGIPNTTGGELAQQFAAHMRSYNPTLIEGTRVTAIEVEPRESPRGSTSGAGFRVTTDDQKTYEAKAVIVASGAHAKTLGVPGETEYRLKGVSYCTVCDGPLFRDRRTVTIGGGNAALESALMLADISSHTTIINKNATFKGEPMLLDNLLKKKNVTIIYEAMTTEILGDGTFATGLKYRAKDGTQVQVDAEGMFVHIGHLPNTQMLPPECEKDAFGYVRVGLDGATNVPGLFAAGDVTTIPHKQIIIAAGMGAVAALSAVQYLNRLQ